MKSFDAKNRLYFENLDALRFLAAMAVLFHHISIHLLTTGSSLVRRLQTMLSLNFNAGFVGVSFFFVLSGFLITYLMLYERERSGRFSVLHFYVRRFLRIWPLYYMSVFVGFVVFPFFSSLFGFQTEIGASPWMYSMFLANFDNIQSPQIGNRILGVQWSVAIEEQFYLVWPLIFAFMRKRYFFLVLCLMLVASNVFQKIFFYQEHLAHFHTLTALNELTVGGFLAVMAFHYKFILINIFGYLTKKTTLSLYVLGLFFLFFKFNILQFSSLSYLYRFLASLFFGFVILEQTYSPNSFLKFGRIPFMTQMGRLSYGIYLLHMIPLVAILHLRHVLRLPLLVEVGLVIGLAIGLSILSFSFFERPFLALKKQFSHVKTGGV